jgi:hypothetical protein
MRGRVKELSKLLSDANYQCLLWNPDQDVLQRSCASHFHAEYAEFKATVDIKHLRVLEGELPRRALDLVLDWAELHREEFLDDWNVCRAKEPPKPIAPLL